MEHRMPDDPDLIGASYAPYFRRGLAAPPEKKGLSVRSARRRRAVSVQKALLDDRNAPRARVHSGDGISHAGVSACLRRCGRAPNRYLPAGNVPGTG